MIARLRSPFRCCAVLPVVLALVLAAPAARAQPERELMAVLDFEIIGAEQEQAAVLTNQLRAELLRTGRFVMVNRAELDRILDEQALQQAVCTEADCAVEVGRILGVRKIVTGTVTKVTDTLWQVSASLTDVETSQLLRQEVVNHAGDFSSLFLSGMASVAQRLAATDEELIAGALRLAPESIAPALHDVIRETPSDALVLSPDSTRLYYGSGEQVHRWNVLARAPAGEPLAVPGEVTALAVNRKGDRLAAGTDEGTVTLFDLAAGEAVHTAEAHDGAVRSLAFSPADDRFASGGADERIVVYPVRTGEPAFRLEGPRDAVVAVRFAPEGTHLLAASADLSVRVYDVNRQREVRAFNESAKRLLHAELSRDGAWLAIAAKVVDIDLRRNRRLDTELVKVRDFASGEELVSFEAHEKDITALDFLADPRYLATGGADERVKIWDLEASTAIANLSVKGAVTALDVSPNGRWLVGADDGGTITIWEVTR